MIVRTWKCWAQKSGMTEYVAHYEQHVVSELRKVDGFRSARLLRSLKDGEYELLSLVEFDSMESIAAFAGDQTERAVVAPEAQAVLSRYDDTVTHYEVCVEQSETARS